MLNKTKAATPGRSCHYIKLKHIQDSTLIDQVNYLRLIPAYCEHKHYSGLPEYKQCLGSPLIQIGCNNKNQQVRQCLGLFHPFFGRRPACDSDDQLLLISFSHAERNTSFSLYPQASFSLMHDFSKNNAISGMPTQHRIFLINYSLPASLACLRWRRLISPSRAVTTNCPVLSPSSFKRSTASAILCGTRTSNLFDLAFTDFVAITGFLAKWCPTIIYKKIFSAMLDVSDTNKIHCVRHLCFLEVPKQRNPGVFAALPRFLTTMLLELTLWLIPVYPNSPRISVSLSCAGHFVSRCRSHHRHYRT